jgi:hypothetical protein
MIFDVPASEAAAWAAPSGEGPSDDSERFAALVARVDGKDIKIAAHVALGTSVKGWNTPDLDRRKVSAVEMVKCITETENNDSPTRYRPTAFVEREVGTTLEVEPFMAEAKVQNLVDAKQIHLQYTLAHDVALPREADLSVMVATAPGHPPKAVEFEETWKGGVTVNVDKAQFIGSRIPPGDTLKGRLHVAFFRVRVVK